MWRFHAIFIRRWRFRRIDCSTLEKYKIAHSVKFDGRSAELGSNSNLWSRASNPRAAVRANSDSSRERNQRRGHSYARVRSHGTTINSLASSRCNKGMPGSRSRAHARLDASFARSRPRLPSARQSSGGGARFQAPARCFVGRQAGKQAGKQAVKVGRVRNS